MSTTMPWSFWSSLIAVTVMIVAVFHVSAQADSPKKHRGPCEIQYPSDATLEWDCRIIHPGESLEAIFGEYWVEGADSIESIGVTRALASQSKCRGG